MSGDNEYHMIRGGLRALCDMAFDAAKRRGFHSGPANIGNYIANLHGEVSELWEAYRKGQLHEPCDKKTEPQLSCAAEELADIVIRCADTAKELGVDLGEAVIAKMDYNETRPHRHGGKLALPWRTSKARPTTHTARLRPRSSTTNGGRPLLRAA